MTNDEIRDLALSHGFTLRPQPDGSMDLNPYVYAFARTLIEKEREACEKVCVSEGVTDDERMAGQMFAREIYARNQPPRGE